MPCTLPTVIVRALREPTLTAADFTPMTFTPADTKAWFGNHFLRFVSSDFPKHQFTLRFYRQVVNTFGHIAHYDVGGYWAEFFTTAAGKVEFIDQTLRYPCYGDATHTFSDVEHEIARRLRQANLLHFYSRQSEVERDAAERAEFTRLKARFEPDDVPAPGFAPTLPLAPPTGRVGRRAAPAEQLAFAIEGRD